jgi:hypothetical protein
MTYNKFIRYGDNFELYEYEKEPTYIPRPPRKPKSNHDSESLGADRKDSLSEEQLGKRQDNAWRARLAFRRLVASNLSRTQPPLLITLT